MTQKKQDIGAWVRMTIGVLTLIGVVWGMSARTTMMSFKQDDLIKRVQRIEALVEDYKVMKEKINNIEKTVKNIERRMR